MVEKGTICMRHPDSWCELIKLLSFSPFPPVSRCILRIIPTYNENMKLVLISKSFAFTQNRSKRKEEGREVLNARIVRDERWLKKRIKKAQRTTNIEYCCVDNVVRGWWSNKKEVNPEDKKQDLRFFPLWYVSNGITRNYRKNKESRVE